MVLKEIIEALTDDFISIITTLIVLYMALTQVTVPDWLIAGYGLILAFYFKKST